jgi:shikimate dehydrogenase
VTVTVTGRTSVLAIIADPVEQTRAPLLVNAELARRGHDAVMVPFRVRRHDLARAVAGLRTLETFKGGVVSMPHKSGMLELLDDASPDARLVGACNVVRRDAGGRLIGTMLDGEGFVAGLRSAGHDVRGKRVFLAGAGGAAAAIAFALGKHGATSLAIHNRTTARAETLAVRVAAAFPGVQVGSSGPSPTGCDLVVNATALGMRPGDALPLDATALAPGMLAAEIVMQPATTPFLTEAGRRGCAIHRGEPMLAAQIGPIVDFLLG